MGLFYYAALCRYSDVEVISDGASNGIPDPWGNACETPPGKRSAWSWKTEKIATAGPLDGYPHQY